MRIRNEHHSTQYPTNINEFTKVKPVTYNFKGYGEMTFYALCAPNLYNGRVFIFFAPPNSIEPFWNDPSITGKSIHTYPLSNLRPYAENGIAEPENVRQYTITSLFEANQNQGIPQLGSGITTNSVYWFTDGYVYFLDSSLFTFDSLTDSLLPGWENHYAVKSLFESDSLFDNTNPISPIFKSNNAAVYTSAQVTGFFGGSTIGNALRNFNLSYTFTLQGGYHPIKLDGTVASYPMNTLTQNGRSMQRNYIFDSQQSDFIAPTPPVPIMVPPQNMVVLGGETVPEIVFSADQAGTVFNWSIDGDDIGISGEGSGNFPAFTAIETSEEAVATVYVTPILTRNGQTSTGTTVSFTITVTAFTVTLTLTKPLDITVVKGSTVAQITFSAVSNKPNYDPSHIFYTWTTDNPSVIGLEEGEEAIPAFTASITGVANITVTATFNEVTDSKQFKITVMAATTGNITTKGSKKVRMRKDVSDTSESYTLKCQKILASATASADVKAHAQSLLDAIAAHNPKVLQYNGLLKNINTQVYGFNLEVINIQNLYRSLRGLATKEAQNGSMSVHDVQRIGIRV